MSTERAKRTIANRISRRCWFFFFSHSLRNVERFGFFSLPRLQTSFLPEILPVRFSSVPPRPETYRIQSTRCGNHFPIFFFFFWFSVSLGYKYSQRSEMSTEYQNVLAVFELLFITVVVLCEWNCIGRVEMPENCLKLGDRKTKKNNIRRAY